MTPGPADGDVDPLAVLAACEAQAEARDPQAAGARIWRSGVRLAAERLRLDGSECAGGIAFGGGQLARIAEVEGAPGRFRLAETGEGGCPVLIWPLEFEGVTLDLLAVDLRPPASGVVGRRFWRLTGWVVAAQAVGSAEEPGETDRVRLRQDAHAWVRAMVVWEARRRAAKVAGLDAYADRMRPVRAALGRADPDALMGVPSDPVEARTFLDGMREAIAARETAEAAHLARFMAHPPPGVLVLDPAGLDWTKRGVLRGIETIEILDAPAGGPLGRAITRLNPRIGGRSGVALAGEEPARARGRAAA